MMFFKIRIYSTIYIKELTNLLQVRMTLCNTSMSIEKFHEVIREKHALLTPLKCLQGFSS